MDRALNEVKNQAKILLKLCKKDHTKALARMAKWHKKIQVTEAGLKLKHCQFVLARELGFIDWQHLQKVLSGTLSKELSSLDLGTLFYPPACFSFLNKWFTTHQDAIGSLDENHYLLPHKKQFFVVTKDYIDTLGITDMVLLSKINRDMFFSYPGNIWDELTLQVLINRR